MKEAILLRDPVRGYTLVAAHGGEQLYGPFWTLGRIGRWATENGYTIVREEAAQPKG